MEENQEHKHCCKFCNKRFPCGRSLGGHMRSHMTINSAEIDEKGVVNKKKLCVNGGSNSNCSMGFEGNGNHAGYGLRENPKKTWRLSDSKEGAIRQEKVCKECGKGGFQSWKALFGHMRCHSMKSSQSLEEEEEEEEEDDEEEEEEPWGSGGCQKLVMDSQSDNEGVVPKKKKRSRRTRYGMISSSLSVVNASSCVFDIEQEQEEVAICLMMLSRDVWGGLNSIAAESSDNHSVVLEVRSTGIDRQITENEGLTDFVCNGNLTAKMKKPREKKRSEFGVSRGSRNGLKKIESDVSDNGFFGDDEFNKKTNLDESYTEFDVSDAELGEDSCKKDVADCSYLDLGRDSFKKRRLDYAPTQLGKCSSKVLGLDRVDSKLKNKYNLSKRARCDSNDAELVRNSDKNSEADLGKDHHKKSKYECTACNKIFHSYQALGGHRASHKKIKGCFASRVDDDENVIEDDIVPDQMAEDKPKSCKVEKPIEMGCGSKTSHSSKKIKGHECAICFKVFASGQALGGHKRSHLIGSSEARSDGCQTIVNQQPLPEIHDLLDLNLPAPIDEDTNKPVGFNSWWVGNNHKHEPLVGLISN